MDITKREVFLGYDKYGIDPLLDEKFWALQKVEEYSIYVVSQQYEARPDLLALDTYSTEKLWWIILQYNGLTSYKDITAGAILRMPDTNELALRFSSIYEKKSKNYLVNSIVKV